MSKFNISPDSPKFSSLPEWWFECDGSRVYWRPVAPYLFAQDERGTEIIEFMKQSLDSVSNGEDTFIAAHPGVHLPSDFSNSLTVLHFSLFFSGSSDDDEDGASGVKYSRNAPRPISIYGPSHDRDGNQIIY